MQPFAELFHSARSFDIFSGCCIPTALCCSLFERCLPFRARISLTVGLWKVQSIMFLQIFMRSGGSDGEWKTAIPDANFSRCLQNPFPSGFSSAR